ncbi:MAG: TIGR02452 family protein [Lachnospiraceae bacterium]|nr:TIGR02452 family protein [Candidatus Minthocola equi]
MKNLFPRSIKSSASTKKSTLSRIFFDTFDYCEEDDTLSEAVKTTVENQTVILESDPLQIQLAGFQSPAEVIVSDKRCIEAASSYARKGQKVCVLNFASAGVTGGGVKEGESALEESICRVSTLFRSIARPEIWEKFYLPHRKNINPLHNDDVIYSPEVVVFKSDVEFPELLPETEWFKVDVLSCAAPNLRKKPGNAYNFDGDVPAEITDKQQLEIFTKRFERIFKVAHAKGAEVLILGAFGCGAFRCKSSIVAKAAKTVATLHPNWFKTVEFAVYSSSKRNNNLKAFAKAFNDTEVLKRFEQLQDAA